MVELTEKQQSAFGASPLRYYPVAQVRTKSGRIETIRYRDASRETAQAAEAAYAWWSQYPPPWVESVLDVWIEAAPAAYLHAVWADAQWRETRERRAIDPD